MTVLFQLNRQRASQQVVSSPPPLLPSALPKPMVVGKWRVGGQWMSGACVCACLRVCACVSLREREKERDRESKIIIVIIIIIINTITIIIIIIILDLDIYASRNIIIPFNLL
jgi:hypothetical protein